MKNKDELEEMFKLIGLEKEHLHNALLEMGKDYLKKSYKSQWTPERPTTGYCYIVSQVIHYCLFPNSKSWCMKLKNNKTHWFIKLLDGTIIDLTADQFDETIDYSKAHQQNFMNNIFSNNSKVLANKLGLCKFPLQN